MIYRYVTYSLHNRNRLNIFPFMQNITQKYQYFSKALLSATIIMLAIILGCFIWYSYNHNFSHAEKEKLKTLQSIAKSLTLSLDGDIHERLTCQFTTQNDITSNAQNKDYQTLHTLLKKAQELNGLTTPIYTLFRDDVCGNSNSGNHFVMGVTSTNPFYRHQYLKSPKHLHQNYEVGGIIGNYNTNNGQWLSAYAPIKNSIGKTVAVIQVDQEFTSFIQMAQKRVLNESLYIGLFLSILSALFIFIYRYLLSSMSKINQTLDQAVTERTKELNKSNLALKEFNEKLEILVEKRTKALEVSNHLFQDSNEKLKAFARVASHDLQAPLRSIKGFGQLLKRRYGKKIDQDGNEFLDFITDNSQKMSDLIKEILETSLLPSENTVSVSDIDLDGVVEDVNLNLKNDIEKYKAQINYNNLPTVNGYRSDFIQLFQNFISNSIKYSRPDVAPKINIESQSIDDYFSIKISDNGKGISKEALSSILTEFERGDSTDNEGYGIGLATCQRILKGYDGTLKVTSEVGVGTCFTMTLKDKSEKKIETQADAVEVALGAALRN